MSYKIFAYKLGEKAKKKLHEFSSAVEARNWLNENTNNYDYAEIFNIEKWDRQRLNAHAQLEEECKALGKSDE